MNLGASWHIVLLGALRAEPGGAQQAVTRFRSQKYGALLAYLALFPRFHPREELADLFWPDADPEAGRTNLRTALSSLRRQLEPPGVAAGSVLVTRGHQDVGLEPTAVSTDVAVFERAIRDAARPGTPPDETARLLADAVNAYGGALLPGFYETWALTERDRLAEAYLRALRRLTQHHEQAGNREAALEFARRALGADPLREEAHADVIRLLVGLGQQAAARRQYEELTRLLDEELGEEPSAETRALLTAPAAHGQSAAGMSGGKTAGSRTGGSAPGESAAKPAGASSFATAPAVRREVPEAPTTAVLQLPLTLTRFFGREDEIGALGSLLRADEARLVTMTGPGGSGKTRLSIEAARRLAAGGWQRSVWFVPLADLSDAGFIFPAIRDALKLPSMPNVPPREQIMDSLAARPSLLILDNFEQLVEDGAPYVQDLLERLPDLAVLVTSRQKLNLPGEREFPVAPLPVPGETPSPVQLKDFSSAALFIDRAQVARVDFRVDDRNAAAVASICRRLDGIPLAIELAAARSMVLSPGQMLEKLKDKVDVLASRQRGIPERHRTLRAAIEWSYGLLSPELRRLFARLSVFRGGWTIEAAEAVCQEPEALDALTRLRECSLVVTEDRGSETRFRMLETLREYAGSQIEAGERADLERRYAAYFGGLAEAAEPHLRGPEQAAWLERLEAEQENFRAVLAWGLESDPDRALGIAAALCAFWETRGHYAEGRGWLEQALAKTVPVAPPTPARNDVEPPRDDIDRARALGGAGWMAWYEMDLDAARARLEESLTLFRQSGDLAGTVGAISGLGMVLLWRGEHAEALALCREGADLLGRVQERRGLLPVLAGFGWTVSFLCAAELQDDAWAVNREVATLARAAGDKRSLAWALDGLGMCRYWKGDWAQSRSFCEESLALFRQLGELWGAGHMAWLLGNVAREEGRYEEARARNEEAMSFLAQHKSWAGLPYWLESAAYLAIAQNDPRRAARLLGAADRARETQQSAPQPLVFAERRRQTALLDTMLDAAEQETARAEGRALTDEEAFAYAQQADARDEAVGP